MSGPAAEYRPDIDGLRAVAVIAVIAYHAFPELLPGGFLGVDVFFVISGFLIANIIFGGLARGSFSCWRFYANRICRLFPALITVLSGAPETRMASDFEIAQMQKQAASAKDFLSQLSAHLNLGDLYLTRNETATARSEYAAALDIAGNERLRARKSSEITQYATATAYAALYENLIEVAHRKRAF